MYEEQWNRLVEAREDIVHYSPVQAIKSMRGIAKEKYFVMEHHYPSRMEWINKFSYDPKQLHHLLRVEEYIYRYIQGVAYKDCLLTEMPEFLKAIKCGCATLNAARDMANKSITNIDEMCEEFLKKEHTIDKNIDTLLDDVQYEIMKIAIKKEIGE